MTTLAEILENMTPAALIDLQTSVSNQMHKAEINSDDRKALKDLLDAIWDAGIANCGSDYISMVLVATPPPTP